MDLMITKNQSPVFVVAGREMSLRQLFVDLLEEMGYDKTFASPTGLGAWKQMKRHGADFVAAGMQLKDMDGLTLLEFARADDQFAEIPFLLIAEVITQADVLKAGQAGVSDILCRPLTPARFKEKVEQLLHPPVDKATLRAVKHYENGLELMEQGRWQEALTSFHQVLTCFENPEVHYNLGCIHTVRERYEEAIIHFRRAVAIDRRFTQAYLKMSECYRAMGNQDQSRRCQEIAAGMVSEEAEDDPGLQEQMLAAIKDENAETINVYNTLGIIYRRRGQHRKAVRQYERALRVSPSDEHIHFNLGRCLIELGDYDRAVKSFTAAVRIKPNFHDAKTLLRACLDRKSK